MRGDCLTALAGCPDDFFQLIVTLPPFADSRSKTYVGTHPAGYVECFSTVLSPDRRIRIRSFSWLSSRPAHKDDGGYNM